MLITRVGQEGYTKYVLLTSLPSLIPFADFGLGSNVFNFFADKSKGRFTVNTVSETFILSAILSGSLAIGCVFISRFNFKFSNFPFQLPRNEISLGVGVLCITFFAVPFSLAAKKLFAEGRVTTVFLIQGTIPLLTLLIIVLCVYSKVGTDNLLYFAPSIAYLLSSLVLFLSSRIFEHFEIPKIWTIRENSRKILKLGGWSLCVTTVVALVWQTPKYILQLTTTNQELTKFSLMSLFLIPGLSVTSVTATWHTTNIRRIDEKSSILVLTQRSIRNSQIASILFSFVAFIGFIFLKRMGLSTPDLTSQILAFIALFVSPTWLIPLSALTDIDDFKWVSIRIVPFFILSNYIFYITSSSNYAFAILLYVFTTAIPIRYFAGIRLKQL